MYGKNNIIHITLIGFIVVKNTYWSLQFLKSWWATSYIREMGRLIISYVFIIIHNALY